MHSDSFDIKAGNDDKAEFQLIVPIENSTAEDFRELTLILHDAQKSPVAVTKAELDFVVTLQLPPGIHKYSLILKRKEDQLDTRDIIIRIAPNKTGSKAMKIGAIIDTSKKYTKLQSLALEEDVILSTVYDFELARDKNMKIDLYAFSGIIVFGLGALIKDHIAKAGEYGLIRIKEYIENGGKACFVLQPLSSEQNSKLIEHFGVTTIEERIFGDYTGKGDTKFSMDGKMLCPLFNSEIGSHMMAKSHPSAAPGSYTGPFIGNYLSVRKSVEILDKAVIQSQKTNTDRIVSCKIKLNSGEAWFISDFTGLYAGSVTVNNYDLFSDLTIDNFKNNEAARAIINWLSIPAITSAYSG